MRARNINLVSDEVALLADIANTLRILAGRKPLGVDGEYYVIPDDDPVVEAKAAIPLELPLTVPEEPKPAKAGRPKTKSGDGGGA